jgi:hypothetical protein
VDGGGAGGGHVSSFVRHRPVQRLDQPVWRATRADLSQRPTVRLRGVGDSVSAIGDLSPPPTTRRLMGLWRDSTGSIRRRCVPGWPAWSGEQHLPWVLLGLRAAPKEDSAISAAELVFGTKLALPGELLAACGGAWRIYSSWLVVYLSDSTSHR